MAIQDTSKTGLALAVRTAGSQSAFGRAFGIPQQTIQQWLKDGKELPAEHVRAVEKKLGISRHDLRPDLYPREEEAEPARYSAEQPPKSASCPKPGEDLGGPSSPADDGIAA